MIPPYHNALHPVTLSVDGLTLEGFSISAIATWITVKELDVVFDMGECALSAIPYNTVFLTHIHGDHSRCLTRHWQLRKMFGLPEATYFVPKSTVEGLRECAQIEARMEGILEEDVHVPAFQVIPLDAPVTLNKRLWTTAFPVNHKVDSVGYTVGRTVMKLRPEYACTSGAEIAALRKNGTTVSEAVSTPILTFIGDCDGATLTRENHIWDSRVVVIECTFVEEVDIDRAVRNTHTHLRDIVHVLEKMVPGDTGVQAVVLKHFSLRDSKERVLARVDELIPAMWRNRVHVFL